MHKIKKMFDRAIEIFLKFWLCEETATYLIAKENYDCNTKNAITKNAQLICDEFSIDECRDHLVECLNLEEYWPHV